MIEQRNCVVCGTEFSPRVSAQKSCGAECGAAVKRSRKLAAASRWRERRRIREAESGGAVKIEKTNRSGDLPSNQCLTERPLSFAEKLRMKQF